MTCMGANDWQSQIERERDYMQLHLKITTPRQQRVQTTEVRFVYVQSSHAFKQYDGKSIFIYIAQNHKWNYSL